MGFFDLFKSDKPEQNSLGKPSVDLRDFEFLSDDHTRFENGRPTGANNKGALRGIKIQSGDQSIFYVTMYNMDGDHPVWGNNIQMAEKQMKVVEDKDDRIVLRGYGNDTMGASFSDYGLTLQKVGTDIQKVTLHMYDRNIEIVYLKANGEGNSSRLSKVNEFDNFNSFVQRWNTTMPMNEKIQIAQTTDALNNKGAIAYNNNDITGAIAYFEQALKVMPSNDDALQNLRMCYLQVGNRLRAAEMQQRIDCLS